MFYMAALQALSTACAIFQVISTAVDVEPTWSCYEETGSCYILYQVAVKRTEAHCRCLKNGGYLLKIDSQVELNFIRRLLANTSHSPEYGFYIGAGDSMNEGDFVWDDGTNASGILPWAYIEPNNANGGEHCVILHNRLWYATEKDVFADYMSFDVRCASWFYSIWEKGITQKFWKMVAIDEKFPSSRIGGFPYVSLAECANLCSTTCKCKTFGWNKDRQGGHCFLYNTQYSRIVNKKIHIGYVTYT